ncbi:hypothetical protein HYDPIDRAFT_164771 [Hydnomerulius pinastri MD-312]|nr:hypothetical protein HYDPIDRAFT_164771 [Hydnomerulius pinastri MD-312]
MSIASPTLIPRPPVIPLVLPKAPHVGPTPLPKADRFQGRINHRRDLLREADDLSEEENDLEDCIIVEGTDWGRWIELTCPESGVRVVYPDREAYDAARGKERRRARLSRKTEPHVSMPEPICMRNLTYDQTTSGAQNDIICGSVA